MLGFRVTCILDIASASYWLLSNSSLCSWQRACICVGFNKADSAVIDQLRYDDDTQLLLKKSPDRKNNNNIPQSNNYPSRPHPRSFGLRILQGSAHTLLYTHVQGFQNPHTQYTIWMSGASESTHNTQSECHLDLLISLPGSSVVIWAYRPDVLPTQPFANDRTTAQQIIIPTRTIS